MAQRCFASISDTGLHCAWCISREVQEGGEVILQMFCEKHGRPCQELNYYCHAFVGYKPDYKMSDEEELLLVAKLRNK